MRKQEIRKQIRKYIEQMKYVNDPDFTTGTRKKILLLRAELASLRNGPIKFCKVQYKWDVAKAAS